MSWKQTRNQKKSKRNNLAETVLNTNPRIFVAIPETYKFVPLFTVLTALLLVFMHVFQLAHYYIHSSHYQVRYSFSTYLTQIQLEYVLASISKILICRLSPLTSLSFTSW